MVRQYIGARYVTKIYENSQDSSSAEWEANINYEPLVMVTYNYGSYLSKKEVPASVGNPANNPSYWVQTGFYNGQIASLQNQLNTIVNTTIPKISADLNGHFTVIESSFDTTLDSGVVQKVINNAAFRALGITPANSSIMGWSAYNHASNSWWSNDFYPAPYLEIKEDNYTINVSALAAGGNYEQQITNLGSVDIIGYEITWNSTSVLSTTLASKGSTVYVQVHNTYNSAITDTGTLTIKYFAPSTGKPVKNAMECIVPKLRYDSSNNPILQVESLLQNQYDEGDTFRVVIFTYDNVVQL